MAKEGEITLKAWGTIERFYYQWIDTNLYGVFMEWILETEVGGDTRADVHQRLIAQTEDQDKAEGLVKALQDLHAGDSLDVGTE